ncbi:unnamed protein product, partial [Musa hybrid cultivar]
CRRGRPGQARAAGSEPGQVHGSGGEDPQRLPLGGPTRHRQNAAGPSGGGRGWRALLLVRGVRIRGAVRGYGGVEGPGFVRESEGQGTLHCREGPGLAVATMRGSRPSISS